LKNMEHKKLILDFIRKNSIGVLATVTPEGMPEAAVIEFAETDDFELIFDTFTTYRKYQNLLKNPHVAFVVGWDENITVQYEGTAKELKDPEELQKYKSIYFTKNPDAKKWEKFPETVWFKVTPRWIRYRDGNTDPLTLHELKF